MNATTSCRWLVPRQGLEMRTTGARFLCTVWITNQYTDQRVPSFLTGKGTVRPNALERRNYCVEVLFFSEKDFTPYLPILRRHLLLEFLRSASGFVLAPYLRPCSFEASLSPFSLPNKNNIPAAVKKSRKCTRYAGPACDVFCPERWEDSRMGQCVNVAFFKTLNSMLADRRLLT